MSKTGVKFRSYPTGEQAATLSQWCGCARLVWNLKVEDHDRQRKLLGDEYEADQKYSHLRDAEKMPWLEQIPSQILRNVTTKWMNTLWKAHKGECGYPRKHKKLNRVSVMLTAELFHIEKREDGKLRLILGNKKFPLGELAFGAHRKFDIPRSIVVSRTNDRWYVSFCYEDGIPDDEIMTKEEHLKHLQGATKEDLEKMALGIDRGVVVPVSADGKHYDYLDIEKKRMANQETRRKRHQRRQARQDRVNKEKAKKEADAKKAAEAKKAKEARKAKGNKKETKKAIPLAAAPSKTTDKSHFTSKRRKKTKNKIAKTFERQANVRKNFAHQTSNSIVNKSDKSIFVMEHLRVKNMTKAPAPKKDEAGKYVKNGAAAKAGLNKAILNVGWNQIETFIDYKAKKAGKVLFKIDPHGTSQECAVCGHTHPGNRKSQADFACGSCGHTANADSNADAVIKKRAINLILHPGTGLSDKGVLIPAADTGRGGKRKTKVAKATVAVSDEASKKKASRKSAGSPPL